jgi:hypothetical protein
VAFFSDPWADNPFRGGQARNVREYNLALERSVIEGADSLVFTCEEMVRIVVGKYSLEGDDRVSILPHSFKPDWYGKKKASLEGAPGMVNILLTGNFYGPRSPLPLLAILRDLNRDLPLAGRLRLHLYGLMPETDRESSLWQETKEFVGFHGRIDYLSSLALMQEAHYLLLVDAPVARGKESVFFPSKLADYLGSGTPVIGLTPRSGASARVLRETGHLAWDIGNEEEVRSNLRALVEGVLQISPRTDEVRKYEYRHVGDTLAAILSGAVDSQQ